MNDIKNLLEKENKSLELKSFSAIYRDGVQSRIRVWGAGLLVFLIVILFLPWTQNIRARGSVTTRRQEQRPQEVNTIIGGRIVKWYVKEGDYVKKGDTLVQLAEIKDNYLDPKLLERTKEQLDAKSKAVESYGEKALAYSAQIEAIERVRDLKMSQLKNKQQQLKLKVYSDSMELVSANNDFRIAEAQYKRQLVMRDSGLVSLVQLEQRSQYYQSALAKKIVSETKFTNTKTDLINNGIEITQASQEYAEKLQKAMGERASTQSEIASGQAEISKLSNQYANYTVRSGQYYLLAPQSGQITQANKSGINEIIKEGEKLAEIIPDQIDYAVELYVNPMDMPLISLDQEVRFLFDGFPAIVFSGWPMASYGTFRGKVVAVENSVSENGKFRILVAEEPGFKPWPKMLKMGTGASGIALLKDVPIWYELWRNISGFPPDYYKAKEKGKKDDKKK